MTCGRSLGEAYAVRGDLDLAIASYERSVQLNPGNTGGVEKLAELKRMKDRGSK